MKNNSYLILENIQSNTGLQCMNLNDQININGGSEFTEWLVEKLAYLLWQKSEVSPSVSKNNYNGTYWNAGMRSVI